MFSTAYPTRPLFAFSLLLLAGCAGGEKAPPTPVTPTLADYSRPLPPGTSALRRITDPALMPDLAGAWGNRDVFLLEAIDQSLKWFAAPSSRQFFPFEGITHVQAEASLLAMQQLLEESPSETAFIDDLTRQFDVYQSVGYDGSGTVLFTGYYAPVFEASRDRTDRFTCPLYHRPSDLVTDPVTGRPQGRRTADGGLEPYPTRREIEQSRMLRGSELVWLEDALNAYIVHVNGSAKLRLTDGSYMYIGYAGKTDRPYASLGRAMARTGLLRDGSVTLTSIKRVFREQPQRVQELMYENQNYVFFTEYAGDRWPAGSLGVQVTRESSLATDKSIYPRGGIVLVDTKAVNFSYDQRDFLRFMLDQDTGGAIQAPGRADIYMGIGPSAEILAGGQYAEGRLYYLFLKPEFVEQYKRPERRVTRAGW
ncbi:MAG: MltA domain-containing protein [Phycisphaerales bacterium]|nr:MAG: MltA domain-containing protein [Phycisphaerales bacterium]